VHHNGTPALLRAVSQAEEVLVGSLLNLDAVVDAIPAERELTVICSGTDGRFALEDAYAAGRIVERLAGPRSDAARGAERLAAGYPDSGAALAESADAAVLRATGQARDIASAPADRSPPTFREPSPVAAAARSSALASR
jgi:phosphosulfolactate phosphohydrolase-like enzyme